MKHLISLIAAFGLSASLLSAQDNIGIPADVFYLMPKMAQGTLLFRDKSPITGQFNICAVLSSVSCIGTVHSTACMRFPTRLSWL